MSIVPAHQSRRGFLGRASAASLGAVVAAMGLPDAASAADKGLPPELARALRSNAQTGTLVVDAPAGTGVGHYNPGLINLPRSLTYDTVSTYPVCTTPYGIEAIWEERAGTQVSGCNQITAFTGTGIIHFEANQHVSNYTVDSWTIVRLAGSLVGVIQSTISASDTRYPNHKVTTISTRASNPALCFSTGDTSTGGTDYLQIFTP